MMKISIVTPSLNQGQFIEEAIQSVLVQHYENFEHIIIDGGSTDNTIDILKKYPHLIWVSEPDTGQSHAINKGFKMATGEIVAWINSDDILINGALSIVGSAFMQSPDLEVFTGSTIHIDELSQVLFVKSFPPINKFLFNKGVVYCNQQSWFWKRTLFNSIGFLDENCHTRMDLEFIYRQIIADCKFGGTKKPLGCFRKHEESKTGQRDILFDKERWELAKRYKMLHYGVRAKRPYYTIYQIYKLIGGYYFYDWIFNRKYTNKNINTIQ